jgi:hypothetical protein
MKTLRTRAAQLVIMHRVVGDAKEVGDPVVISTERSLTMKAG